MSFPGELRPGEFWCWDEDHEGEEKDGILILGCFDADMAAREYAEGRNREDSEVDEIERVNVRDHEGVLTYWATSVEYAPVFSAAQVTASGDRVL